MNEQQFLGQEPFDVKKYIFKIISNWYWFFLAVIVAVGIAYFKNRYANPVYSVGCSILVKDNEKSSLYRDEIIDAFDLFKKGKNIPNEMGVLRSYDLTRKTLEELDFSVNYYGMGRIRNPELYRPYFKVIADTSKSQIYNFPIYLTRVNDSIVNIEIETDQKIKKTLKLGEKYEDEYFSFWVTERYPDQSIMSEGSDRYEKYFFYFNDINSLTNSYRSRISMGLAHKDGSILNLYIAGYIAQKEVDYLNKLSEVYIRSGLEEKNMIATKAIEFIDNQISNIMDSLSIVENRLLNFRTNNKIINLSQEGTSLFQKMDKLQADKALLIIQSRYYNYLYDYLNSKDDLSQFVAPAVASIEDPLLRNLIVQLNGYYIERSTLNYSSKKENPALDLINLKIKNTKSALIENVQNLIKNNQLSQDEIEKRITRLDMDVQKLPVNERKLINIQKKFDINNEVYTYLLQKRAEAGIMRASNIPDVKVLDLARTENAVLISPKSSLNYSIAFIIGLVIPLIIIIIIDYLNDKILDRKDIEKHTKARILGVIGHNTKLTELVVIDNPKSSITESFRAIKTNMQYALGDKPSSIISVTSTISGEGKSFCSINLACIYAMTNKKTLLVGLDLRKPKVHREFNLDNSIGVSTYLVGQHNMEEIIFSSHVSNLFIAPAGKEPPNPAQLLETSRMTDFFEYIKSRFEVIIIDTPPIALVSDALFFSRFTDANIFVVRQNYSHKNVLSIINELNENTKISGFSIVINDVRVPGYYGNYNYYGYYGYGYSYGYGYGYGYGRGYSSGKDYYNEDAPKYTLIDKILIALFLKRPK